MARPRPEPSSALKIGWLEAFIAVAQRGSYVAAGEVLGVNRTAAQRNVSKLEMWMRRVLVMDDELPHTLSPDGKLLMPLAVRTLRAFETQPAALCLDANYPLTGVRKTTRTNISLNAFRSLAAFKTEKVNSYDRAGSLLGIAVKSVRFDISNIERIVGYRVVKGYSTISLTEDGLAFLAQIEGLADALTRFRSTLPPDFDPARVRAERHHGIFSRQATRLSNGLLRYKSASLAPCEQLEVERIRRAAEFFAAIVCGIEDEHGSFRYINGSNISVDGLTARSI